MRKLSWMHVMLAAAMVVVGGAVLAFAGGEPEMHKMVKVNVNGDVESLELDDLADGETREFAAGEHTVTVTRIGNELSVLLDGEEIGGPGLGGQHMIWVTKDELVGSGSGTAERMVIVTKDAGDESDLRTIMVHAECDSEVEDCEKLDIDIESLDDVDVHALGDHPHALLMTPGEGPRPLVVSTRAVRAGMVRYRCEETGAELLLREDDAVADSYTCPATGCLMERVDEPEIKIIKLRHEVETPDGGTDE
jgi:hypothetical protein